MLKKLIKKTIIANIYYYIKKFVVKAKSQSNESEVINRLVNKFNISNTFIEFGFSGWEFNCADLASETGDKGVKWSGLLIDGDSDNSNIANTIFHKNIVSKNMWLSLNTLDIFYKFKEEKKEIGILSLDIDGNEYWLLEKLITLRPDMIICEFNIALGLLTITTPYDPEFDRTKKHESWSYYGVSITALNYICIKNGYKKIDISSNGVNAFFLRDDLLTTETQKLIPEKIFKIKNYNDGSTSAQHFELI